MRAVRGIRALTFFQRKIEFEDVDARLAQDSELAAFGELRNQRPNLILAQAARTGHAWNLVKRRCDANVLIESVSSLYFTFATGVSALTRSSASASRVRSSACAACDAKFWSRRLSSDGNSM